MSYLKEWLLLMELLQAPPVPGGFAFQDLKNFKKNLLPPLQSLLEEVSLLFVSK